jgi:methyl-accepting chemotaxis protein WspA
MLELVDRESRALLVGIALSFTLAVGLALVVGLGLFRSITTPLARLGGLMDAVRQGDFTQRMEVDRTDEFGDLARGFNRMTDEVMELVGQVQRSGIRVSTSMTEIAATSKQQQATATEVAATTTQIGATSREIAATSRELVRTMTDVASVADNAASLASSGQSGLAHMEETMGHVMEAASSINAKLAVLNEKAGEYGRGFAVVSSEIRRLADQTAVATYDIEQMVKEIQSAVSAGVMGMDKFSEEVRRGLHDVHEIGGKLSEIIAQVQALAPRFENVSEGMQAQATGAEQISEALVQLTEATQQTVEALRQSSSAIDELNQVSGNLHGSIARFKLAAA